MSFKRYSQPPEQMGFVYRDKEHEYWLDKREMTGVTSILSKVGDSGGLMQYAANFAAAKGITTKAPKGFSKALKELVTQYGKLSSEVARELDKKFPVFKEARLAHMKNTKEKADRGTDNHALCEDWESGKKIEFTPAVTKYANWYKENVGKTWFVERPLFSKEWFVGGTPDGCFQTKEGKNFINDKKFKDSIYDNKPFWQMAAYRKMMEEMKSDWTTPIRLEWADGTVEEYKNPVEYLVHIVPLLFDGSVVIQITDTEVKPIFRFAFDEDLRSFESALWIYKHIKI